MVERLFNDLAYIFNKKIIFIPKKHLDVFKSNYIFWFFDSYFSKSDLFNFCNDEDKDEFLQFLDKYFKIPILELLILIFTKKFYFCQLKCY
nr:hypothetical protein [Mycoplasmopsis bovis]